MDFDQFQISGVKWLVCVELELVQWNIGITGGFPQF